MALEGDPEQYLDLGVKRPVQDVRYAINDDKLKNIGWSANADFDSELKKIVEYYRTHFVW
jgi:dTDP-D-glucose 4,6-dehydratase